MISDIVRLGKNNVDSNMLCYTLDIHFYYLLFFVDIYT